MNILIIEHHFSPTFGGVERVSYVIGEGLRRRGHRIHYAFLEIDDDCVPKEYKVMLPVKESAKTLSMLSDCIEKERINALLCQNLTRGKYPHIYKCLKKKYGIKIVSVLHSNPDIWVNKNVWGCTYKNVYFKEFIRSLKFFIGKNPYKYSMMSQYDVSDRYVLLSKSFIPVFRSLYGVEGEKLRAISNPCAFSDVKADVTNKENMLLVVSRMAEQQKRISNVLWIWQRLQGQHKAWHLVLLGSGPDLDLYRRKAKQMGLERIEFKGACSHPEDYYCKAKIFLMTSSWEGFGMTLVEAQHYGCVPFVYDSYAAVHDIIVSGENGVIIPHHDIDCYCDKLSRLMKDDDEWSRMSANARTMNADKLKLKTILDQWEKLFKELNL